MTLRALLQRSSLVILGLAVGFALAELAVRTLTRFGETSPPIFRPSSIMPWQLEPAADAMHSGYWGEYRVPIRINSLGYRDREFSLGRQPGTCRILALGDSFTFGWGVREEETYSTLLEADLNARAAGARVEIINAGYASGYAPDTALVYFRTQGFRLRPQIVLLGFFEGNDVSDELYTAWPTTDEEGWPTRVATDLYYIDTVGRLRTAGWIGMGGAFVSDHRVLAAAKLAVRDHSQFANFLIQRYRMLTLPAHQPVPENLPAPLPLEHHRAELKARRSLDGLRAWTKRSGADLVVLSIPFKGQTQASALLRSWADATQTPLVDLAQLGAGQADLYFARDAHWAAEGHRRAARSIANALEPLDTVRSCLVGNGLASS